MTAADMPRDGRQPLERLPAQQAERGMAEQPDEVIVDALTEMVMHPEYPCLGARSVFRRTRAQVVVLSSLAERLSDETVRELSALLRGFAGDISPADYFASLLAVFRGPATLSEAGCESRLWALLQRLSDLDDLPWAAGVAADPADPHFAFSHGGTAFFVVGLHPGASRIARRAPLPTVVFNLHAQFDRLRAEGGFTRLRAAIRRRDVALSGSVNPMVADYGSTSEARQYSGRVVETDWIAPLDRRDR